MAADIRRSLNHHCTHQYCIGCGFLQVSGIYASISQDLMWESNITTVIKKKKKKNLSRRDLLPAPAQEVQPASGAELLIEISLLRSHRVSSLHIRHMSGPGSDRLQTTTDAKVRCQVCGKDHPGFVHTPTE